MLFKGKQILLAKPLLEAQKEVIRKRLQEEHYSEHYLEYYKDYLCFYAKDVVQSSHKNLTQTLNNICRKPVKGEPVLIKCHRGLGVYAKYCFPKDVIEKLIEELKNEDTCPICSSPACEEQPYPGLHGFTIKYKCGTEMSGAISHPSEMVFDKKCKEE